MSYQPSKPYGNNSMPGTPPPLPGQKPKYYISDDGTIHFNKDADQQENNQPGGKDRNRRRRNNDIRKIIIYSIIFILIIVGLVFLPPIFFNSWNKKTTDSLDMDSLSDKQKEAETFEYDLRLYELEGPVASVEITIVSDRYNWVPDTIKHSPEWDASSVLRRDITFNRDGRLESFKEWYVDSKDSPHSYSLSLGANRDIISNDGLYRTLSYDSYGRITQLYEEDKSGYYEETRKIDYNWLSTNYIESITQAITFDGYLAEKTTSKLTYDENNFVISTSDSGVGMDGNEFEERSVYRYTSLDKYGNWTERVRVQYREGFYLDGSDDPNEYERVYSRSTKETRKITYY